MTGLRNTSNKHFVRHILGFLITFICLYFVVRQIKVTEVIGTLHSFDWGYLVPAVFSLILGYTIRVWRWSLMLSTSGRNLSWGACLPPFIGSVALNNILPLRMGDIVRAFVFPSSMGITKSVATSSMILERLLDLSTILLALGLSLVLEKKIELPRGLSESILVLSIFVVVFLLATIFFSGKLGHWLNIRAQSYSPSKQSYIYHLLLAISMILLHSKSMSKLPVLINTLMLSIVLWSAEAGLFYFIMLGFGFEDVMALALCVMAIATLSTLIPSSPGYVGPFHLAAYVTISMVGGTNAEAASYAVIAHLALWLPTTLAGIILISMNPSLFRKARLESQS